MLTATILFVLVTAIVRYIGNDIPASQAAFIRYVIGTLILLPFIIPLIKNLLRRKAKVILISHLGRPKGKIDQKLSLKPIASILETALNSIVHFFDKNHDLAAEKKLVDSVL